MTRGNDEGKKIDEIKIEWDSKLVVRYHADRHDFTVEAGDWSERGPDLRILIERGTVHMKGWSDLKWEPVIRINTEVYTSLSFEYSRMFRAKHKGKDVFRCWKLGEVNEGEFGSRYRDEDENKTADRLDGGEPGRVMGSRGNGRILPYTHDLWTQLRKLSAMLSEAMDKANSKLTDMLNEKNLTPMLESVTGLQTLGISFKEKK